MAVDAPDVPGPKFEIISKAITAPQEPGSDGKRRFHLTASSTIEDRAGDEITRDALEKAAQAFRDGITIFMDHDYRKVNSAFGLSDTANVIQRGMDKAGRPVWDLDIEGVVNVPNPRALQLADTIDGGYAKLGASITAFVRKHQKKANGGMLIHEIEPVEASVVGIGENQRSWAHKAALAIKSYGGVVGSSEPEDEDDMPDAPTLTTSNSTTFTTPVTPTIITIETPAVIEKQIAEPEVAPVAADEPEGNAEDVQASTAGDPAPEETPETASDGADSEADPVTEKALGVPEAQVSELLSKVGVLVQKMSDLQTENETLKAQNAALAERAKVAEQVEDVSTAIQKALDIPLRPRAASVIEGAVRGTVFEGFPEVQEYLNKRSKIQ